MKQLFQIAAAVCAAVVLSLAPVRAEIPKVLDHVSPQALAVIATPNLGKLDANASQLSAVMGMPQMATIRQAMQMIGLREGVNFEGSMAIVLLPGDLDGPVPPAVALVPTSDHDALMRGFGAATNGAISSFDFNGERVYAKKMAGGYTVMGPIEALVAAYGDQRGHMRTHRSTLGRAGVSMVENSDVMVMAGIEAIAPALDGWVESMRDGARMAAAMGGGDPAQVEAGFTAIEGLITTLKNDGRAFVAAASVGALGLGFDMGVVFNDGSESAKMFQKAGNSRELLKSLPGRPFMLAGSMDYAHPAVRNFFNTMSEMHDAQQEAPPGAFGAFNFMAMFDKLKGQSFAIYPNPAGPMAGVLANTIIYSEVENPREFVEQSGKLYGEIRPTPEQPMEGVFTPRETEVNGNAVAGWAMRIDQNHPMAGQMMMGMNMVFGAGGLNGYMMATDSGVYQTFSKNSQLLRDALGAKQNASLADDAMIKQIGEQMPGDRMAEGYLNLKPILDQVMPFMMMFGMPPLQVPAELPPVGCACSSGDGAMRMTTFVPAEVLRLGAGIAEQLQEMAPPRGAPGNGRPRF